jgi:hypothetical protein
MAILGPRLLPLSLALFSLPQGVGANLRIEVYDYSSIRAKPLARLASLVQEILGGAGTSVEVTICRGNTAVRCKEDGSLQVRVLPGYAKQMSNARRPSLGMAFSMRSGGMYCTVFLGEVQDQAASANAPWLPVLAHTAAHEIGHLLLGNEAHTTRGIMREAWDRHDYELIIQNQLRFTAEQARQLASRYGAKP